jgi:UDP-N-acetylmuramoylalanine--D-glutamate ligase
MFPSMVISIADANGEIENYDIIIKDSNVSLILGNDYLSRIQEFEFVLKSPGISFKDYAIPKNQYVSSQTDLFLYLFSEQTIGITGTKGKSTTSSLLKHVLSGFYDDVLLVGNIGVPALEVANRVGQNTKVVFEMSSHQLEFVNYSPKIAVLLNLYQEHLDHYSDYKSYRFAKWNIAKFQSKSDCCICCIDETQVVKDISNQSIQSVQLKYSFNNNTDCFFDLEDEILNLNSKKYSLARSKFALLGKHNLYNAMAVLLVCDYMKLPIEKAIELMMTFQSLPHRLEFVAEVNGIKFYNDSISTIPQATIKALESVNNVGSLILGGFDRGIDYELLISYLTSFKPLNIMLLGNVGTRIYNCLQDNSYLGKLYRLSSMKEAVNKAFELTPIGSACLLSPAASSYDSFKNFEERGDHFKELVQNQ